MTEDEIKEMKAIINEYLEKIQGHEQEIRETPEDVELWTKDLDLQISSLYIAAYSLSNSQFYASKAAERLRELTDRIKVRKKEARDTRARRKETRDVIP